MDEVIDALKLTEEITVALTERGGIFGQLLRVAELFEQMDFTEATRLFEEMGLTREEVLNSQVKAYSWRKTMQ